MIGKNVFYLKNNNFSIYLYQIKLKGAEQNFSLKLINKQALLSL